MRECSGMDLDADVGPVSLRHCIGLLSRVVKYQERDILERAVRTIAEQAQNERHRGRGPERQLGRFAPSNASSEDASP